MCNIELSIEELYTLNDILQSIKEYENKNLESNHTGMRLYNNYTKRVFDKIETNYNDVFVK